MRAETVARAVRHEAVMIGGDLVPRVGSALVLGAIVLVGAWFGGIPAGIVTAAAAAIVHAEWSGITEKAIGPAAVFTAVVAAAALVAGAGYPLAAAGIAGAGTLAAGLAGTVWRPLGVAYASAFALSLLALRDSEWGFTAIAFVFFVVIATDTAALFAGRGIGGPKLWPALSPKKTWAGAIGGFLAANVAGFVVAAIAGVPVVPEILLVASVLSVSAQCGDLFESFVKRHFGAKDSGNIMPGHGGLMDRVDGIVFAGPVALLIGWLHAGAGDFAKGLVSW